MRTALVIILIAISVPSWGQDKLDLHGDPIPAGADICLGTTRFRHAGGQGADAAHWLSMHSGESIIVDRKTGHPRMIYVPRAAVCITGSIQPGVLHRALGTEHRLLVSCPPRQPKQCSEAGIESFLEHEMGVLLDRLYDLQPEIDDKGESQPQVIHMTEDARKAWIEFYNTHNQLQGELTGELAAAWSKLEEYAARFALVVHCVRAATGDHTLQSPAKVDVESIASGVTIARWFGQEAQRVYDLLSESEEQRERRELVDLIRLKGGRITPRELTQSRRQYQPTSVAEEALNDLGQHGYGRWLTTKTATKPRREFVLTENPSTNSP
jgi:hypothetical protein